MFLSYCRRAYYAKEDSNFRLTFDCDILARNYKANLNITPKGYGIKSTNNVIASDDGINVAGGNDKSHTV